MLKIQHVLLLALVLEYALTVPATHTSSPVCTQFCGCGSNGCGEDCATDACAAECDANNVSSMIALVGKSHLVTAVVTSTAKY